MGKEKTGTKQELKNQLLEEIQNLNRAQYQTIETNFDNDYTTENRRKFIADLVYDWQEKNNSSNAALAGLIGVSRPCVGNWINPPSKGTAGKTITRKNAIALGLAMRVSLDDLIRLVLCSDEPGMFPREGFESEIVDFVEEYLYNNGEYPSIEMVDEHLISTLNEGIIKKKKVAEK